MSVFYLLLSPIGKQSFGSIKLKWLTNRMEDHNHLHRVIEKDTYPILGDLPYVQLSA